MWIGMTLHSFGPLNLRSLCLYAILKSYPLLFLEFKTGLLPKNVHEKNSVLSRLDRRFRATEGIFSIFYFSINSFPLPIAAPHLFLPRNSGRGSVLSLYQPLFNKFIMWAIQTILNFLVAIFKKVLKGDENNFNKYFI